MAWIRAMGGNVPTTLALYDSGTWNVPYDNGGYTFFGSPTDGATLNPTTITATASASRSQMIGTANKIDLTNYSMLKIRCSTSGGASVLVSNSKNVTSPAVKNLVVNNASEVEYVINVSDLSGDYYICFGAYYGTVRSITVKSIILE